MEEEIFMRMGISANFNEANFIRFIDFLSGEKDDMILVNA